jgi:hypothetical protein
MSKQKRPPRTPKKPTRGAAMIEAIVIMLTMLTFLGMNLFAVKAYGGKLDQSTAVRRDVMYYATHNCAENNGADGDTYTDPALRGAGGASGSGGFIQDMSALIRTIAGRGSLEAGTATGTKGSVTVTGEATVWTSKRFMQSTMRTSSAVVCNEKPYYGGLLSTIGQLAWGFVKGLKDLF